MKPATNKVLEISGAHASGNGDQAGAVNHTSSARRFAIGASSNQQVGGARSPFGSHPRRQSPHRLLWLLAIFMIMTAVGKNLSATQPADPQAKMDALFRDFAQPGGPGAAVMVVHRGKVLFSKGYGLADVEGKVPCATNTNFRLASVTKQFTAMAILILAERGKLSLDETLTDCFPEFPAYGKNRTLRHLLSHTSGLIDYEDIIPAGTTIPVL